MKTLTQLFFYLAFILLFNGMQAADKSSGTYARLQDKPNIIFVNVDDLGWKDVGFMKSYNHEGKHCEDYNHYNYYYTPHLDKLAENAAVFTRGYAAAPICTPSRIACLTGQDTSRTKAHSLITTISRVADGKASKLRLYPWVNRDSMIKETLTLPEMLKEQGYRTVHAGKFGAGGSPLDSGFDVNFAGGDQGSPQGVPKGGYFGRFTLNDFFVDKGEYLTDKLTDSLVDYVNKHDGQAPFFINLWYYNVHTPIQATKERIAFFKNRKKVGGHNNANYAAMIKAVDDSIGRIVSALESRDLLKNTLIVFTSDNGGFKVTEAPPLKGSKGTPFENGIRVPFFIYYPKAVKARVIDDVVATGLDIYPTLMDAAGRSSVNQPLDGNSLMPVLRHDDRKEFDGRNIYMYQGSYVGTGHGGKINDHFEMVPAIIVYNQRWKYMHLFEYNIAYLYDMKIGEKISVAEQHPEVFKKMQQQANDWMKKRGVPTASEYIKNPNWDPNTKSILGNPVTLKNTQLKEPVKIAGRIEAPSVRTTANVRSEIQLDFSGIINSQNSRVINPKSLDFQLRALSGNEIIDEITVNPQGRLIVKSNRLGIAEYKLTVSGKAEAGYSGKIEAELEILSEFLIDCTRTVPNRPNGSVNLFETPYPADQLVKVAPKIKAVDQSGKTLSISPGDLVSRKAAVFPHNQQSPLTLKAPVSYFGYKENERRFFFNFNPVIPMLVVGDGDKNRGAGIIAINSNQIQQNATHSYVFEGFGNIRTRSDAPETYNLGVVVSSMSSEKPEAAFLGSIVGRDHFKIGYSTTGQLFTQPFKLADNSHLVIAIVGEAGKGRDRNRTTRFEYIKIKPLSKFDKQGTGKRE